MEVNNTYTHLLDYRAENTVNSSENKTAAAAKVIGINLGGMILCTVVNTFYVFCLTLQFCERHTINVPVFLENQR